MKRDMHEEEVSLLVIVMFVIVLALWLIAFHGCAHVPAVISIRDEHGTLLATADTTSGDIRLTRVGLHIIRPTITLETK